LNRLFQREHRVTLQELKEILNGRNMKVIQNQESAVFQVRVEKVILQIRERVAVGSVNQGQLQLFREAMPRQSSLRGALHESHRLLIQERRSTYGVDAAAAGVQRKHRMVRAYVREQKRAGAGTRLRGMTNVLPLRGSCDGFEGSRGEGTRSV
jgi:hypothetical protein